MKTLCPVTCSASRTTVYWGVPAWAGTSSSNNVLTEETATMCWLHCTITQGSALTNDGWRRENRRWRVLRLNCDLYKHDQTLIMSMQWLTTSEHNAAPSTAAYTLQHDFTRTAQLFELNVLKNICKFSFVIGRELNGWGQSTRERIMWVLCFVEIVC